MKQLVSPNLGQQSEAGWCLFFARSAFGAPAVENSAWEGWLNTDFKHTDALPNVSVPVWFQHYGSYGNPPVYKNWGHVAIYVPGRGFLSSPITFIGPGQQWFDSIDALVNEMNRIVQGSNTKYVGWSEDISNVKVVEGKVMDTVDRGGLETIWKGFLDRPPTDAEYKEYVGKAWPSVLHTAFSSDEYKNRYAGLVKNYKTVTYEVPKLQQRIKELESSGVTNPKAQALYDAVREAIE